MIGKDIGTTKTSSFPAPFQSFKKLSLESADCIAGSSYLHGGELVNAQLTRSQFHQNLSGTKVRVSKMNWFLLTGIPEM